MFNANKLGRLLILGRMFSMQTRKSSPTFYQNKVDGCDGFSALASNTCINLCNAQGSRKKFRLTHGRTVCTTLV